jgi:hypothetical protein
MTAYLAHEKKTNSDAKSWVRSLASSFQGLKIPQFSWFTENCPGEIKKFEILKKNYNKKL